MILGASIYYPDSDNINNHIYIKFICMLRLGERLDGFAQLFLEVVEEVPMCLT